MAHCTSLKIYFQNISNQAILVHYVHYQWLRKSRNKLNISYRTGPFLRCIRLGKTQKFNFFDNEPLERLVNDSVKLFHVLSAVHKFRLLIAFSRIHYPKNTHSRTRSFIQRNCSNGRHATSSSIILCHTRLVSSHYKVFKVSLNCIKSIIHQLLLIFKASSSGLGCQV